MITKGQLLASMRHETEIIKHLATKVPPGGHDYRPTPGQRSTLELMRYMTRMSIVPAMQAVSGSWDHAEELSAQTESVTPENFAAEMDRQMAMLQEVVAPIDEREAEAAQATMPWGAPTTVGAGLMDMALKTLVAYRMQFFLYLKAAGAKELGPANCWAGVDRP